jgi:flagellar hook assembly protein FlgD
VRRLPVAAFVALAIATVGAFFLVQSLKVTTPLISGLPTPHPSDINPVSGGVCPLAGGKQHTLRPTSFRRMRISFLLLNRADDVNVQIVDGAGSVIDTIARNRYMAINRRQPFVWDGHRADGAVAPSGSYYVQVTLIHQRRTVRISSQNTGALEAIHVEDRPTPIAITAVRAGGEEPAVYPQTSGRPISIRFTVVGTQRPTVRVYRTDVPGRPQLVDTFHATTLRTAFWDGTLSDGRPAPQGTYLMSISARDRYCSTSMFPMSIPPAAGSTNHDGVTVRYLAAQPPMTAVAPGATATVEVDSRRHQYTWTLTRAGSRAVLHTGRTAAVGLKVPLPGGDDRLYVLSLRWGSHRTAVPLVAGVGSGSSGTGSSGTGSSGTGSSGSAVGSRRVLVVLPALTWQGLNEVDDDGDGIPNMLTRGTPIRIERPFAHGLPAGLAGETGLLSYLRSDGLRYRLTTDLSLISGGASLLRDYSGVVLAGSERWLPSATGTALSTWVQQGGRLLSLGTGALQRTVTVSAGVASDPSAPHQVDALLARPETVRPTGGSLLLVDANHQGLFSGTAQALTGFRSYQAFGGVQAPARLLTSAGVSPSSPAVIGYALGRGAVVDIGLPGFGSALARNVTAQDLIGRAWRLLLR